MNVPWPPPSAASVQHLHDLGRSPVLRHTADLYWTAHLPEVEREQVLDHMTLHDLRNSAGARLSEQRLINDLAAFWADHPTSTPAGAARREGVRPRAPRRRAPRIPHLAA